MFHFKLEILQISHKLTLCFLQEKPKHFLRPPGGWSQHWSQTLTPFMLVEVTNKAVSSLPDNGERGDPAVFKGGVTGRDSWIGVA